MYAQKNLAIISYLTPIGWIISFVNFRKQPANRMLAFHLRQSLGLHLGLILGRWILNALFFLAFGQWLAQLLFVCYIGFLVLGVYRANRQSQMALPYVGKYFEEFFGFIR